ncbi:MAG: TerC family protein, partial [Polynucleobacter victoriensis]
GNWWFIIMGLLISIPVVIFGSSMVTKILDRWPNAVFVGSFVLFAVAMQMVIKEPLFESAMNSVDVWVLKLLPWAFAIIATAIQFGLSKKATKGMTTVIQ